MHELYSSHSPVVIRLWSIINFEFRELKILRNLTAIIISWASISYLIKFSTNYNYFSDFSTTGGASIELPYLSQSYLMLLSLIKHFKLFGTRPPANAYSERCQTSLMERFAKMVNGFYPFTEFVKHSILDV